MTVKPRKYPTQQRARATVDAIIEASAQLLIEQGHERLTTARAAHRAGVSVGSLYQYFPNKAALVAAVIERSCDSFLAAFETALASRRGDTLADSVGAIVAATLVSHRLSPELHRLVIDLAPRIGVADRAAAAGRAVAAAIEATLHRHQAEIAPEIDLPTAATLIETLLEALSHRTVQDRSTSSPDVRLAAEAARMILRYLTAARNLPPPAHPL